MNINKLKEKLFASKLFKDSFWAVFGNGLGSALLLLSGILIARFLGKDVYGEYGVVKSTMFYISSFATFGLGFTSTKYIAQYIIQKSEYVKSIIRDAIVITLIFSGLIAFFLIVFAQSLANYVGEPSLTLSFQALAGIIIFRAVTTTQIGILAGYKEFKRIAVNSMLSGAFMFLLCVPLTYIWGLIGSLASLLLSQVFNSAVNLISINKIVKKLEGQVNRNFKYELIKFSFPVALQESSYTICNWGAVILLTKLSSAGELGLYSAAAQWNSIILMIPSLLNNVILSYLSGVVGGAENKKKMMHRLLAVNAMTTIVPFLFVYCVAEYIANYYGPTFVDLPGVLRVLTFCTVFEACSTVYKSEYMAEGRTWSLFIFRFIRDTSLLIGVYFMLSYNNGSNGAYVFSCVSVLCSALFLLLLLLFYNLKTEKSHDGK